MTVIFRMKKGKKIEPDNPILYYNMLITELEAEQQKAIALELKQRKSKWIP